MFFLLDASGRRVALGDTPLEVGSSKACAVCVDEGGVAPVHLRFTGAKVEALARCTIGGVPLEEGQSRLLAGPTVVTMGRASMWIEDHTVDDVSTRRLALDLFAMPTQPTIMVVEGNPLGRTHVIGDDAPTRIGRSSVCELALPDVAVSREHASVRIAKDGTVVVRDLGSVGGTFLGGARIEPERDARWPAASLLVVGKTVLGLRLPHPANEEVRRAATAESVPVPPPAPSTEARPPDPKPASIAPTALRMPTRASARLVVYGVVGLVVAAGIGALVWIVVT